MGFYNVNKIDALTRMGVVRLGVFEKSKCYGHPFGRNPNGILR